MPSITTLAEQLLLAVKMEQDTKEFTLALAQLALSDIRAALHTDNLKKAFWINIYNAYFQILRKEHKISKPEIFKSKLVMIAGQRLSLDDVEHGILRRYRYKYSLGFFPNLFTPRLIKNLTVKTIDYRIHFALNCGAKSCPPIAFYKVDQLDTQLDMATQSFLDGESTFDDTNKILYTTALFKWFLNDFGGTKGIRTLFKAQLSRDISGYTIKYNPYSWDEELDNFSF